MIEHEILLLSLAIIFGIFMSWSVGANDLANIMSTTMGSKAITVKQAIIIAIIFEITGAVLGGSNVAQTMQHGIINSQAFHISAAIFIYGMLAVLLASAFWLTLASFLGMPVSITNTTVGAMVGFGLFTLGSHAVYWKKVAFIATSWVVCPAAAGLLAYLIFLSIQRLILVTHNPAAKARQYAPIHLFLVGFILSEITVIKAIEHFGIILDLRQNILLAIICGIILLIIGQLIIRKVYKKNHRDHRAQFILVEKIFSVLMIFTACAMIYAHGSNDVAISVGPVAAIISLLKTGHPLHNGMMITTILTVGSLSVIIGFLSYGRKIIATVGSGITALTPSRAYCATIAAAITVIISTSTGIPVSATQTLVGAILGVGLARGIGALDLRIVRNIFASWIITIPIAAGLTTIFCDIIKKLFS